MFKLNHCLWLSAIFVLFQCANAWIGFDGLGGGVNHVAVSSWGPGRIDVFGPASDGSVWHKVFSNSAWSGWSSIGGNTPFKPAAFSMKSNWVDVVYTGTDKALYRKTWDGKTWIDWKKNTNGGSFISGPTLTTSPGETRYLHVFVIAADKTLNHCVIDVNENRWTTWESLGGGLLGDPAAVSWGSGRFDVFSIAVDNQLWQLTYENGWQGWKVVSGGSFNPGVGATSKGSGSLSVFCRGFDDAIYTRTFSSGAWSDLEKVGGKIKSSPSAVSTGATRVDVFGVGSSDSAVYRSYWDTSNDDPFD